MERRKESVHNLFLLFIFGAGDLLVAARTLKTCVPRSKEFDSFQSTGCEVGYVYCIRGNCALRLLILAAFLLRANAVRQKSRLDCNEMERVT